MQQERAGQQGPQREARATPPLSLALENATAARLDSPTWRSTQATVRVRMPDGLLVQACFGVQEPVVRARSGRDRAPITRVPRLSRLPPRRSVPELVDPPRPPIRQSAVYEWVASTLCERHRTFSLNLPGVGDLTAALEKKLASQRAKGGGGRAAASASAMALADADLVRGGLLNLGWGQGEPPPAAGGSSLRQDLASAAVALQ